MMLLFPVRLVNAASKSTYLSSVELLTCSENQTKLGCAVPASRHCSHQEAVGLGAFPRALQSGCSLCMAPPMCWQVSLCACTHTYTPLHTPHPEQQSHLRNHLST